MDIEFLAVSPAPCKVSSLMLVMHPVTGSLSNLRVVPTGERSNSTKPRMSTSLGQYD